MDNAAKALIIAGVMLLAIMILTLVSSLYTSLGDFVENSQENLVITKNHQFNEQFTKYINLDNLTIHDVVTAASAAYQNNVNGGTKVEINIKGSSNIKNLETKVKTKSAKLLKDNSDKRYKCSKDDIKINPTTGRVYEVNFYEL